MHVHTSIAALAIAVTIAGSAAEAQVLRDSNLGVRTVVSGLTTPTTMAFIGPNDFLIAEKNTGKVQRVTDGIVTGTVLDLAVNFASERGLLGIALRPGFPSNPGVYLYWTESTTSADTSVLSETSLLGNRVDRFAWDGVSLTQERNIIHLRALQEDAGQPPRGNHDGGVIEFGRDGKLYIYMGDNGQYEGNMFLGAARPLIQEGHLFRLRLTGNRRNVAVDDPALRDRVADNLHKFDMTESESLLFGSGFGVATGAERESVRRVAHERNGGRDLQEAVKSGVGITPGLSPPVSESSSMQWPALACVKLCEIWI